MRTLRFAALAAALVLPAAAAHAQFSVYVGPAVSYEAPAYGPGYWVPGHWSYGPEGRYWIAQQWIGAGAGYYGGREDHDEWREHRDGGRGWDRDRGDDHRWGHQDHDHRW